MIIKFSGIVAAGLLLIWAAEAISVQTTDLKTPSVLTTGSGDTTDSPAEERKQDYWPSTMCRDCHRKIYDQHSQSMHAASFTNPVFQAVYFKDLLPRAFENTSYFVEAESCIACHSPLSYIEVKGPIISKEQVNPELLGVTCDLCHTVRGYRGENPGGGNFISEPGTQKLGPFRHSSNWHHEYSELQTKSEFCGICHRRVNRNGLEIISTFTEWGRSRYAMAGIQCQDCHMNVNGFLTAGKPVYETGKAAHMTLGYSPERERLYTHRFPGAHSKTEVAGALRISIEVSQSIIRPGDEIEINLYVDNSKTGHKMPSGSAELRLVYIDMKATAGERVISIPAISTSSDQYDIAEMERFDGTIPGGGSQTAKRIYRAVCVDDEGRQTMLSYDAVRIVFDNRLNADEVRKEIYRFKIPEDSAGKLNLVARLYYLRYPDSFASQFGIPPAEAVEIASAEKSVTLNKK